MPDLTTLIDRVRAAEGADRDLDYAIGQWLWGDEYAPPEGLLPSDCFDYGPDGPGRPFTASIDAALRLVEVKLPGWSWRLRTEEHKENGFQAALWCSWGRDAYTRFVAKSRPTAALAIVEALLTALKDGGRDDNSEARRG